MHKSLLLLLLIGCLGLCYCQAKIYQAPDFPDRQLQFGSAGGFTGEVRTFYLLPNGQLFVHSSTEGRYRELARLGKSAAKTYFQQAANMTWSPPDDSAAGTMNFFLRYQTAQQTQQSVEWLAGSTLNTEYGRLYEALMEEVQRQTLK